MVKKLNKGLLLVIIGSIVLYIASITNIVLWGNDFESINLQIQKLIEFSSIDVLSQYNNIVTFAFDFLASIKSILIIILFAIAFITIIELFFIKFFAKRLTVSNSLFDNCSVLIVAFITIFTQLKIIMPITNISNLIMISVIAILIISIAYIVLCSKNIYNILSSPTFDLIKSSLDITKVSSLILAIYCGVTILFKGVIYIGFYVIIKQIDIAYFIDIMNYITVDWNNVLPPAVLASNLINAESINLAINNFFDIYVFSFISLFIQNILISLTQMIVLNNIVSLVIGLVGAVSLIYISKLDFEYKNITFITIMAVMIIFTNIYLQGFITSFVNLGFVISIILFGFDYFKKNDIKKILNIATK